MQKTITAIRFYSQDNMTESDTGQDSKNQSGTKNPDRNLPDFLIAKWRLIRYTSITYSKYVVIAGVKLKILKANHNGLRLVVSLR